MIPFYFVDRKKKKNVIWFAVRTWLDDRRHRELPAWTRPDFSGVPPPPRYTTRSRFGSFSPGPVGRPSDTWRPPSFSVRADSWWWRNSPHPACRHPERTLAAGDRWRDARPTSRSVPERCTGLRGTAKLGASGHFCGSPGRRWHAFRSAVCPDLCLSRHQGAFSGDGGRAGFWRASGLTLPRGTTPFLLSNTWLPYGKDWKAITSENSHSV